MGASLGSLWQWYLNNREAVQPLLAPLTTLLGAITTLAVGILLAFAALRQARTATAQAKTAAVQAGIAGERHREQTLADKQRRITESFAKATEQLGSDKIEARLGGIYTLERISKESPDDYWSVMETLTAFVRERARSKAPAKSSLADAEPFRVWEPATDIAAVLTVIRRRDTAKFKPNRESVDLSNTDLQCTDLRGVDLRGANLKLAILTGTDLFEANLTGASLDYANLVGANLVGADLTHAYLTSADLTGARLDHANLTDANVSLR